MGFLSEQETITPSASVMKIWSPVEWETELMDILSTQLDSESPWAMAEAVRATSLALFSILLR